MSTLTAACLDQPTAQQQQAIAQLHQQIFADVDESELACLLAYAEPIEKADGDVLTNATEHGQDFLVMVSGTVRITRQGANGNYIFQKTASGPSFMGEMSMFGLDGNGATVAAVGPVQGLRISRDNFWQLMGMCPQLRAAILKESAFRIQGLQAMTSQQEKLTTLGVMTAGLMHELNNPGAAAKRAAAQLRDNFMRMHLLMRGFAEKGHTAGQRSCLNALQERILRSQGAVCMDSLQQSDREEAAGEWLDSHHIRNAWNIASTLVASGLGTEDLDCVASMFAGGELQEPVEWLEATASSVQQVALVEESVSRVYDLAKAVKTYVHEGQGGQQTISVNESLHATLMLMKHKLREKDIKLEKQFGANLPTLTCVCTGLNQIWTNLLDNAIDAVPQNGHIRVRSWQEGSDILVGIRDDGSGIPPENQERIFDAFFTTKPAGIGTGMGLGIVQRTVENYHGSVTLHSHPGDTEFVVRIPIDGSAWA